MFSLEPSGQGGSKQGVQFDSSLESRVRKVSNRVTDSVVCRRRPFVSSSYMGTRRRHRSRMDNRGG